ncbi:MAG: hypothetical protein KIT09_31995 [Bryobacteraceae bacterium]|nr:hypothetical protein [Bryobacteraceae bacterium]
MKRLALLALAALGLVAADFRPALPGYEYRFPRDHFSHPEFQTEWWYYTGNLRTPQGRRFGFELTFFRHGVARPPVRSSPWQVDDLYLAHLALSDIDKKTFHHRERINRAGPGLAAASAELSRIWNGNWHVEWRGNVQSLQAVTDAFTLRLEMVPQKPPVIHGRDGVSRKGPEPGRASHYVSFTRLAASGALELDGASYELAGLAWMDHEFFTNQLSPEQAGWDWFSVQFENGAELMLARMRRNDGSVDPFSHGTFVDRSGAARHLESKDFSLVPGATWTSPSSGAVYPIEWRIGIAPLGLELSAATPLANQELTGRGGPSLTYWEGAMDYEGTLQGKPIRGEGYLEMVGYAAPFRFGEASGP